MKKLLPVLFILCAVSLTGLFAQEEGKAPEAQAVREVVGRRWLLVEFPSGKLTLRAWLFTPRGSENTPTAAVLRLPAGGNLFRPAVLGLGTVPEVEPYVTAGYVTMVMSFRGTLDNGGSFNESHGGLDDVLAALEFLKKQPEVDPKNIFVAGHSSAASLTLRLAQVSEVPRAVAAFSGVTDWTEGYKDKLESVSEETKKFLTESSPITNAGETKCPVLLTHGTGDRMVPYSHGEAMAAKLKELKKPHEFVSIPQGDHYYSMLRAGIPLSLAYFSEIREHGKASKLFYEFRDNLLKKLAGSMEPKEK